MFITHAVFDKLWYQNLENEFFIWFMNVGPFFAPLR